ncbi:MAG: hypothetical protein KBS84_09510 [Treponema sp.]|nr:hypothetical protein [Candidatus Treponema scatequi]
MRMKGFVVILSVVIAMFFLCGCQPTMAPEPDTYKVEVGCISDDTFSVALQMIQAYGTNVTHDDVKTVRNFLYRNTISDYGIETGVSIDEIRDTLTQKGMTLLQANAEISVLETLGNDIVFGTSIISEEIYIWLYAEKE